MKICLLDKEKFLESRLELGEFKVGTVNALFLFEKKERERTIEICQYLWSVLMENWREKRKSHYKGLIRFDLVPRFNRNSKVYIRGEEVVIDLGEVNIEGFYEVNAASPECATGVSATHKARTDLAKYQPCATKRLVRAIVETFGDRKIVLIKGEGFLKNHWGKFFFEDLRKYLEVEILLPEEFMDNPDPGALIYLYGDYRREGPTEFSKEFMEFIDNHPRDRIFNTLPNSGGCISNKKLLLPRGLNPWDEIVGKNKILERKNIDFALKNKDHLVLKPFLGTSGENIHMGRLMTVESWKEILEGGCESGGYGLFEARWLPKIILPSLGEFAIDINLSFWARGDKLNYLYTIARIDDWEKYWQRGVINVAQGGGFVGTLIDNERKLF
ncbi:MAG: hypothetical protein GF370_00675 [Candidatus Nealsonbacteria bacterium]|nr:hypothetical protein [Candidatus Nealsonbacteria bacterium]